MKKWEWEWEGMGIDSMGMGGSGNVKSHSRSSLVWGEAPADIDFGVFLEGKTHLTAVII